MLDPARKRLDKLLRERRALLRRLRRGDITREEYVEAVRALVREAQLDRPSLRRPWWADDLGWFMRAVAQGVHSGVLREGREVMFLRREDAGFRRASLDGCEYVAVHLGSALPALAACGFGLSRSEVNRALADAADAHPDLVAGTGVRIYFTDAQRRKHAVVLNWARVQALGSTPRRGDPRSL